MYERILVPTDGSSPAVAAAIHAVALARKMEAELFMLQVMPPFQFPIYLEYAPADLVSEEEYVRQCQQGADRHLAMLAAQAQAARVRCTSKVVFSPNATQAIIDAASGLFCQLIVMGSHGRSGLSRLFLGSVTARVLAMSHVPVLVHRATAAELATATSLLEQSRAPAPSAGTEAGANPPG